MLASLNAFSVCLWRKCFQCIIPTVNTHSTKTVLGRMSLIDINDIKVEETFLFSVVVVVSKLLILALFAAAGLHWCCASRQKHIKCLCGFSPSSCSILMPPFQKVRCQVRLPLARIESELNVSKQQMIQERVRER